MIKNHIPLGWHTIYMYTWYSLYRESIPPREFCVPSAQNWKKYCDCLQSRRIDGLDRIRAGYWSKLAWVRGFNNFRRGCCYKYSITQDEYILKSSFTGFTKSRGNPNNFWLLLLLPFSFFIYLYFFIMQYHLCIKMEMQIKLLSLLKLLYKHHCFREKNKDFIFSLQACYNTCLISITAKSLHILKVLPDNILGWCKIHPKCVGNGGLSYNGIKTPFFFSRTLTSAVP